MIPETPEEFEQWWRSQPRWYVFENGRVRPAKSLFEAATNFENTDRVVDRTEVGEAAVSTVFLGLNHTWEKGRPPLLFETMIFGGPYDEYQWRYSTLGQAKRGHWAIVEALRNGEEPSPPEGEETGWVWRALFEMIEGSEEEVMDDHEIIIISGPQKEQLEKGLREGVCGPLEETEDTTDLHLTRDEFAAKMRQLPDGDSLLDLMEGGEWRICERMGLCSGYYVGTVPYIDVPGWANLVAHLRIVASV